MAGETALPCRHPGAPPDDIINLVAAAVKGMASNAPFLQQHGLTSEDFELALPAAIQRIRGSAAASNADRRAFLIALFNRMSAEGAIESFDLPDYGNDTIYRLRIAGIGSVAIIQKGCPDGAHSSVNWSAPAWADETYLWWLCDSLQYEPGEHVAKGVNRLRNRFFSNEYTDAVDGIIFHNATCGTSLRPCPKAPRAIDIGGKMVPPPCIDIMPDRAGLQDPSHTDWNWDGERVRRFPEVLLSTFGIGADEVPLFTGQVGFLKSTRGTRTRISSRYGPGRSTNFRSDPR